MLGSLVVVSGAWFWSKQEDRGAWGCVAARPLGAGVAPSSPEDPFLPASSGRLGSEAACPGRPSSPSISWPWLEGLGRLSANQRRCLGPVPSLAQVILPSRTAARRPQLCLASLQDGTARPVARRLPVLSEPPPPSGSSGLLLLKLGPTSGPTWRPNFSDGNNRFRNLDGPILSVGGGQWTAGARIAPTLD